MAENETQPGGISWKHFFCLVAGAVCIAFAPIFVPLAKQIGGVSMIGAAFWRLAFGAAALAVFVVPSGQAFGRPRAELGRWIWLPGLFFAGDFAVWHWSFDHTSVANSTLLANLSLVLVTLFAWWFWKERITKIFATGACIAACGAVLLIYSSGNREPVVEGGNPLFGDFLGLMTAFFYGSYLLSMKYYRRRFPAPRLMFWASLVSALVLLPIAGFQDGFLPYNAIGWLPLIAVGVLSHAGGQGLIAYGLAGVPASFASVTLLVQPVCVPFLGLLILDQPLVPWQIGGGVAVVLGLGIVVRGQMRR